MLMTAKKTGADSTEQNEVSIDFGERKVNSQNVSKTVVIPKAALTGCGCKLDDDIKVDVQLITKGQERFIKLIPVCGAKNEGSVRKNE